MEGSRREGEADRLLHPAVIGGILVVAVVLGIIGLAAMANAGSILGKAIGAIGFMAIMAIVLVFAGKTARRAKRREARMVEVLSPRTREMGLEGNYPGFDPVMTFVLDDDLALQIGGPSVPTFFSEYFAEGGSRVALRLSDIRRWHAAFGVFRRETRHLERHLDPSIRAELALLQERVHAKSARLDGYVLRDPRIANRSLPREMVRLWLDPRDYARLPELLLSAIDPVRSLLDQAARR